MALSRSREASMIKDMTVWSTNGGMEMLCKAHHQYCTTFLQKVLVVQHMVFHDEPC